MVFRLLAKGCLRPGASMPAYKDTLGESDRWWIIRDLRTL